MIQDLLIKLGMSEAYAGHSEAVILFLCVLFTAYISNLIVKRIMKKLFPKVVNKTKTEWDNILYEKKVFYKLTHLIPAFVIHFSGGYILSGYETIYSLVQDVVTIYMTVVITSIILSVIQSGHVIYKRLEISKDRPIHGYIQFVQIFVYFFSIIVVLATLLNKDLTYFFTGLGAIAAVLMLVFKDTILGFVASIQLSANKMIKIGDWISMPKFNADGDVIQITLNTVKVRNWNKTIATIPTYKLISESFNNWQGMTESGGRRIKRHINIDMKTISKLYPVDIKNLRRDFPILEEYLAEKVKEGRRITNIGTFRKYVELYLHANDKIKKDLTFLVRQLQPTEKGLPIEIYVFSADQRWVYYEGIQADIFDHILSVVKDFDLDVFQYANS